MRNRIRHHGRFLKLYLLAALLAAALIGVIPGAAEPLSPTSVSTSTTTSTPVIPSVAVSSTYRLLPYDVVDISVYNEEDLHTRAKLGADGTVLLPLIGNVSLGGKTVAEANDLIQKRYADGFVKYPHVLLTVLEYRKSTFSILGEVMRPGIYEIPEGTHMNIVDAILLAGGFTHTASQNGVKVKRVVNGKPVVVNVKAGAMSDDPQMVPFEIQSGDIIKVPESWF